MDTMDISDSYTPKRQGEDNFYEGWCKFILRSHALQPQECPSNLPKTNGKSLQRSYQMKCRSVYGRHNCQIRILLSTCGGS